MSTSLLRWVLNPWSWGIAGLVAWCGCDARAQRQSAMVGKLAPEFHIQGIYNEAYSLESFKGHILVMQFGSSW